MIVDGVVSEIGDTQIKAANALTATASQIVVDDASLFHRCIGGNSTQAASLTSSNTGPGNAAPAVSDTNPGFVKIGDEIIAYEYINNGSPNCY